MAEPLPSVCCSTTAIPSSPGPCRGQAFAACQTTDASRRRAQASLALDVYRATLRAHRRAQAYQPGRRRADERRRRSPTATGSRLARHCRATTPLGSSTGRSRAAIRAARRADGWSSTCAATAVATASMPVEIARRLGRRCACRRRPTGRRRSCTGMYWRVRARTIAAALRNFAEALPADRAPRMADRRPIAA